MRRSIAALLASALLAGKAAAGVSGVFPPDPLGPADRDLQQKLTAIADELGISALAQQGRASLMLVDLPLPDSLVSSRDPSRPVHAAIAADTTLAAASMAKLAILTAAYDAAAAGELAITPDVRQLLEQMIRSSANPA